MLLGDRCYNSSDVQLRSDHWPARAESVHAREWPADDAGAAAAAGARRRDHHVGAPPSGTTSHSQPRDALLGYRFRVNF